MNEGRTICERGEKPCDKETQAERALVDKWEEIKQACLDDQPILAADYRNGYVVCKEWRKEGQDKRDRESARKEILEDVKELYPWQEEIIEMIKGRAPRREIYWYVDIEGEKGKTTFAEYLLLTRDDVEVYEGGDYKELAFLVDIRKRIFIFDFVRENPEQISYGALEAIKNGKITSGKYQGAKKVFPKPWVFVFATFEPVYSKLSKDRWKIKIL